MAIFTQIRWELDKIKQYIRDGGDPHIRDEEGRTLLHYIVLYNRGFLCNRSREDDNIKLVLEAGVDPLIMDRYNCTIFEYVKPDYDFIELLLQNKYPVNHQNKYGSTLLHDYIFHPKFVRLILEYGGDPDIKDNVGNRPIDYARQFDVMESIRLLEAVT